MPLSPSAPFRTANAWAVAAAVSVLFAIGLATAPIATADTCDNATLRAQNNSTGLPDCRAYEMVTAPYKEGFDVDAFGLGFTDDGVVAYRSLGSFAGAQNAAYANLYHATRSAAGWVNTAQAPSGAIYDLTDPILQPSGRDSDDLSQSLWETRLRDVPGDKTGFWLRGPDGVFARIGDVVDSVGPRLIQGVSADLSHIVFFHAPQQGYSDLYEYVGTGNGPEPRAVSVDNNGQQTPKESCVRENVNDGRVSTDGRVIVYTSGCGGGITQVWARVAGSATVAVSGSECTRNAGDPGGACNAVSAADYVGAADDGSRVFFTTDQQLVNGDTDTGKDLYACDIPPGTPVPVGVANPCEPLTEVSGTATDAKVENVVAVSGDGSRVYFVAQGVLADNLGVGDVGPATVADLPFGQTEPHNLYAWERDGANPAGATRFVARLDASDVSQGQMTPDGRYLLFVTGSRVVTDGPGADADGPCPTCPGARDAYRYDAVTNTMVRLSTSVSGSGGNAPGFDVSLGVVANRQDAGMTPDGSTVVFDTAEGLSAADTNGVADVYSWRDGQVSLISAGGGKAMGLSASGRDIFFTTFAQVLAADGDASRDVYTARVGGGFAPPRPPASCSGDGCQGLLSGAPGLAAPLSGLSGDRDPEDVAAVLSLRSVSAAQRRRLAATGKVAVIVKANVAGRVSATARAKIAGRSVTVGSGRRTMTTPGSVAVTLKLSRKARAQLAARGRLTVKVVVSHSKATKGRSVTLKLTRARASKSSVGGGS